jgi:hypothetical protein
MIKIEGYNLTYNTDHLNSPKPTTYNQVVERLESLECKLFYNIISSPDCRYEKKFSENRIKDHYKNLDAESRFKNIFDEKVLYANPKSYFVNKLNILPKDCNDIKSVSFSLSDYLDVPSHFFARGSEFGICFLHDFLQNNGLRPVEYLNESDDIKIQKLVLNSPHLIEVFNSAYDMRWENEWRINKDLKFDQKDIAFVIVPPDRLEYFIEWFSEIEDFDEIKVLSSNVFKSYVDFLIQYPQQSDNNWHQVEAFGSHEERGLKLSPECFNDLSLSEKLEFQNENLLELQCLAKNTLLDAYESVYIGRYLKFRSLINGVENLTNLFQEYKNIQENKDEPEDASRDLIKGLFGDLFRKFPGEL